VSNLLRNAVIHTPDGSPVEISLDLDGDWVTLEVRDHGPGLPVESAEKVFDRFWRSEGGRARGQGGAGLGLAIVRAIVAVHGGRVQAENAPGGGARFLVQLPGLSKLPAGSQADLSQTAHSPVPMTGSSRISTPWPK
jgi:two-component system OmpR family sensor kinase